MGCLQQLMHHVDPATVRKKHDKNYPRRPPKPGPGLPKTCQNRSPRHPGEPRCSQEAPKTSQKAPKSAQGAAKKRPRGAQGRPRAAQGRPRRAQEAPGRLPESFKNEPGEPQSEFFARCWWEAVRERLLERFFVVFPACAPHLRMLKT